MFPPLEKKFANLLLENQVISLLQFQQCIQHIQQNGGSFPDALISLGFMTNKQLLEIQSDFIPLQNAVGKKKSNAHVETMHSVPIMKTGLSERALLHHYRIEKEIGRGGMGIVYKAWDSKLDRAVAIKIITDPGYKSSERFHLEAKAMARVHHPNIVTIHEIGDNPFNYLVMEYIDGKSLTQLIKEKSLDHKQIANFFVECARAVHKIHQQDIIHRDIKPSNIMIDDENHARIMDFGLAKDLNEEGLSKTGAVVGTLNFMSPEQAQNNSACFQSDIYSLGASLYNALSGRPPFEGNNMQLLHNIFFENPQPLDKLDLQIPRQLIAITEKCLEKEAKNRYQTAEQLAEELQAFIDGKNIVVPKKAKNKKSMKIKPRKKRPTKTTNNVYMLVSGIFALLAVFTFLTLGNNTFEKKKIKKSGKKQTNKKVQQVAQNKKKTSKQVKKLEQDTEETNQQVKKPKRDEKISKKLNRPGRPKNWPRKVWKKCWDPKNKLVDFTKPIWCKLKTSKQRAFAESYKHWYFQRRDPLILLFENSKTGTKKLGFHYIPPGRFFMGEKKRKQTIAEPFLMLRKEMTQVIWQRFMKEQELSYDDHLYPITEVSWADCQAFCQKLTSYIKSISTKNGKKLNLIAQLPDEKHWEYACRAGTTSAYNWGDVWDRQKLNSASSWSDKGVITIEDEKIFKEKWKNRAKLKKVKFFPENAFGLREMHGNVSEWCVDTYRNKRVVRGGNFLSGAQNCRSSAKFYLYPEEKKTSVGFRVILVPGR